MPHAVEVEQPARVTRTSKVKASSSREIRQLHTLYNQAREHYIGSSLSVSVANVLRSKNRPAVTRILSLGLGSLTSTDQTRRIKQLAILLAIAEELKQHETKLEIYAQDPSFSKTDEAFLRSLDVHVISTPSGAELGEASQYIDDSTLVYCPFLTLEAYQLFFSAKNLHFFIGDDFDALRNKWPKHSPGQNETEALWKRFVQGLRKRVIGDDDTFWDTEDKPFPMAVYWGSSQRYQGKQLKALL